MFYSHQLLARKAPLGQIWMAATMHSKFNRRKLDKLNIIQVCDEILNPAVPMALRLSGILMGGVVIVYERKVKLLYDDVTRLLVEINEAWKVKAISDPTVLPKGKSQAKKEAVTLPENVERDVRDLEQSLNYTIPDMEFNQTGYFAMRLDSVDESYVNNKILEDPSAKFHQADAENITLVESFDIHEASGVPYNRFERFDGEQDDETQLNFTSGGHSQIPTTLIPSPPYGDDLPKINEIKNLIAKQNVHVHPDERKELKQDAKRQGATKELRKKAPTFVMDYQQTIIPGHIYQSWLQNASDIVSRRGRKRKRTNFMFTMKIASLMDLPPVVLSYGLFATGSGEIHYPPPLLQLWRRSIQPLNDPPSKRTVQHLPPPRPSSSSLPGGYYQDHMGFPFEDHNSGGGSQLLAVSIEKVRTNLSNGDMQTQILVDEFSANLMNSNCVGMGVTQANAYTTVTPRNSGDKVGFDVGLIPEFSYISNKKRPCSSSRHSSGGLEPVAEEMACLLPDANFNLSRVAECGASADQELLVETEPTQTQKPDNTPPSDKVTDCIRIQLQAHFETPGASQVESLDHLTLGMNRKGAARLFYQFCVLATRDILKVHQQQPFGEIFVSKGPKM